MWRTPDPDELIANDNTELRDNTMTIPTQRDRTADVSLGSNSSTRFIPASALLSANPQRIIQSSALWSPKTLSSTNAKLPDVCREWLEQLKDKSKGRNCEELSRQLLMSSLLQDLRKYVNEIDQDRWLYKDVHLF